MSEPICPKCSKPFLPERTNQRYCSKACQKNGSRESTEFTDAERNRRHYELAHDLLYDFFYKISTHEKQNFLVNLLARAMGEEAKVKNVLTDPKLLFANRNTFPNISQRVNDLCYRKLGYGSLDVLSGKAPINWANLETADDINMPLPMSEGWDYRNMLNPPLHI